MVSLQKRNDIWYIYWYQNGKRKGHSLSPDISEIGSDNVTGGLGRGPKSRYDRQLKNECLQREKGPFHDKLWRSDVELFEGRFEGDLKGGRLTSDGGAALLREADRQMG